MFKLNVHFTVGKKEIKSNNATEHIFTCAYRHVKGRQKVVHCLNRFNSVFISTLPSTHMNKEEDKNARNSKRVMSYRMINAT